MKFTKTAVAVAIAGFAAAPMIASADTTLSGVVQIQAQGNDSDTDAGDITIAADDVLFGITSEHELNSGLTGYSSLRVDMNRLSNEGALTADPFNTPENDDDDIDLGSAVGTADSVYVGIKGGFGDFRFGEVANGVEVGQVANDIYDVTGDTNGGLGYTGSFGPVGLVLNFSPENNEDVIGGGITFGLGGFSIGLGGEQRGVDDQVAAAAGATFAFAGASIGAHFWTRENGAFDDTTSASVQVGYAFAGISATVTASTQTVNGDTGDVDSNAVRLDAVYDLGGGMDISTRITQTDEDVGEDELSYRLKLSKAF